MHSNEGNMKIVLVNNEHMWITNLNSYMPYSGILPLL